MQAVLQSFIDRIQTAATSKTPLQIRGGGSKDFYGEPAAHHAGELLDTRAYTGITAYEPSELYITVRAGTPLAELEATLAEQGQCLPFEPPHYSNNSLPSRARAGVNTPTALEPAQPLSQATIGGMVASGLSGPSRANAGSVRDYVLGVQLINGRAEHLTFGGQVMKNVAGYDVSRMLVGSLGTLGLLTDISLKVMPVAPAEATLKFEMSQTQALQKLNEWGGLPLPLNASCWVSDNGTDTLYLRLRGAVAAVESACKTLGGERQDNVQTAADWALCRDQQLPWFTQRTDTQNLWRLSVPQTAPVLDLPEAQLIEWHGGQRWVRVDENDTDQAERLRTAAAIANGHASVFIAGRAISTRAISRFDSISAPLQRISQQLKAEFDPAGIFNSGRLSAGW